MSTLKQRGFTMIELIMVIVILGILAAVALPRFVDLSGDARAASIQGAAGAIRSASGIIRATCKTRVNATDNCADGTITVDGVAVEVNATSGYPDPSPAGILRAAGINETSGADYAIVNGDDDGDGRIQLRLPKGSGSATCEVDYNMSGGIPTVTTTITGC